MTGPKEKSHGGNRGFSNCADIEDGSGEEHSPLQMTALFPARVASDAAQAQLDLYAHTTDDSLPGLVDAADHLDAVATPLSQLTIFAPPKKRAHGGAA